MVAITGIGIKGDIHAIRESTRQVLLLESETLERFGLMPGILKENITTAGISLASLARKQRLRVGSALLEITQPCMPCNRLNEIRPGLQESIRGHRGMLARIVQGGTMRVGDQVVLEGSAR
jgi:MOSC domain-containing protein YiiM